MAQSTDTFRYHYIPLKFRTNVNVLAENICNAADKDEIRIENIFYWVTHYIKVDVSNYNSEKISKNRTPNQILKSKKGDAEDMAILIKALCESVGIRCQVIQGYEKNDLYENGAGFYKPNHTWNAVLVNHKWEILDAYNAAGDLVMDLNWMKKQLQKINKKKLYTSTKIKFKQNYHDEYFMQNPEETRLSKIPVDPIWQLTDTLMPLSIFEKTENDIRNFNEKYSEISKFKTILSEVNRMDDNQQILECADRTFEYNPRFTEMKAKKHLALANQALDKNKKVDLKDNEIKENISIGKKEIGNCKEYLMKEKQEIGKEYNELQKVNSEKRTDVIKYKQKFSTINTKFIAESNTKLNTSTKKISTLNIENNSKLKALKQTNNTKWVAIKTLKPEKDEKYIEIKKLKDSISNRKIRIEQLTNSINSNKQTIEKYQNEQEKIVQELKVNLIKTDSSFMKEAQARSRKQDSFDDSVIAIRNGLYYYKTIMVDSLQTAYFDNYDSTLSIYEKIKKQYAQVIDLSNDNLKDYETHKKLNNSTINLESNYNEEMMTSQDANKGYINNNLGEIYFIKNNNPLIKNLKTVYEKENKYFDYLVKTEDDRKELVKKVLEKNEEIEKKRNEYNINSLKEIKEKSTKKKRK